MELRIENISHEVIVYPSKSAILYVCKVYMLVKSLNLRGYGLHSEVNIIPKHALEELLDVEKLKYCFECGICTASCPMAELLPQRYNPRVMLQKIFLNPQEALKSEAFWLCAWCYRCFRRCPQGLKVPEIFLVVKNLALEKGYLKGFKDAIEVMAEEIPLAAICCYVCFHPERTKLDDEKLTAAINQLKSYFPAAKVRKTKRKTQKIAVIGSGPAGLSAAQRLAEMGYVVTVFESAPVGGGMLRLGIPSFRLPREVLDMAIEGIKSLGVGIKTNTTLGKDFSLNDLWNKGYEAVFVAVGAHKSRKMNIEGEELQGVMHALDFLRRMGLGMDVAVGKKVAIIGGGNVAMDAARTVKKMGVEEVAILYRRSREEMPANPWEVKEAEEEGVKMEFLVSPKKILGRDGHVTGLECVRMELGEPDETGRRKPMPIEGSEFSWECDTVILAVGEESDLSFVPKEIETDENKTILVNPITMETTMQGVFAGGDVVTGPASVIEAIVAGIRGANAIHQFLSGKGRKQSYE
jgi:NADPH-dependent glutamate synthase beta subunit-like oxidoreductase